MWLEETLEEQKIGAAMGAEQRKVQETDRETVQEWWVELLWALQRLAMRLWGPRRQGHLSELEVTEGLSM